MKFGKTAAEWQQEREEGGDDEVWIKGFKDGETRIRIMQEPDTMVTYREHFSEGPLGYFPCSEEYDCVGCRTNDSKLKQRTRKFAFRGLNDRGQQQVYKIGSRLHRTMSTKQQRIGTVMDRDYLIIRTGKEFNEIGYDMEAAGEKYAVDPIPADELYDIGKILSEKYEQAVRFFKGEQKGEDPDPAPPAEEARAARKSEPESNGRIQTQTRSRSSNPNSITAEELDERSRQRDEEAEAAKAAQEQPAAEDKAPWEQDEAQAETTAPDYTPPEDMGTADLKAYLVAREVEFPTNAPRSRLVKLAQAWQKDNPQV